MLWGRGSSDSPQGVDFALKFTLFLSASNIDSGKGANTQKVWLSLQLCPFATWPFGQETIDLVTGFI